MDVPSSAAKRDLEGDGDLEDRKKFEIPGGWRLSGCLEAFVASV